LALPPILTKYRTQYNTVYEEDTRYIVSKYRIISHIVTRLNISYYDDAGVFHTMISYPTHYLKQVVTALVGVEERVVTPQPQPRREEEKAEKERVVTPQQPRRAGVIATRV